MAPEPWNIRMAASVVRRRLVVFLHSWIFRTT